MPPKTGTPRRRRQPACNQARSDEVALEALPSYRIDGEETSVEVEADSATRTARYRPPSLAPPRHAHTPAAPQAKRAAHTAMPGPRHKGLVQTPPHTNDH